MRSQLKELLVEIGCEEIPDGVMEETLEQMGEKAERLLVDSRIEYADLQVFGTPRRLVLAANLANLQGPSIEETLGPAKRIAYDADGKPTKAALGFARSRGVEASQLRVKETERGEYVCVVRKEAGKSTMKVLEDLLPKWISSLSFPRAMRWNSSGVAFVRPIRWIASLFGGKSVSFTYGDVPSEHVSYGHLFLSTGSFRITSRSQYYKELRKRSVVLDPKERYQMINKGVVALAQKNGGSTSQEGKLLQEATYSTEWPTAVWGEFDPAFLTLPQGVIVSVMQEHQGYFPVYHQMGLLPGFIMVTNAATQPGIIREGNERVLRARLVDARFYFEEDKKVKLSDRVVGLKEVGFLPKLGSMYDKSRRLLSIVGDLAEHLDPLVKKDVQRAGLLAKADLLSGMVREFPTLQGVMGREYALLSSETVEVAEAISEQYLPRASGDRIPNSLHGKILAIADRIDTIVGCFGLGLIPTGSQDPYALRRQGVGILRIAIEGDLSFSLPALIQSAVILFDKEVFKEEGGGQKEVEEAFLDWMRSYQRLKAEPFSHDVIEVVLAKGMENPREADRKMLALSRLRGREGFHPLILAFKRAARIVPEGFSGEIDPGNFEKPVEENLFVRLTEVEKASTGLLERGDYEGYLQLLISFKEPIDAFFDGVLVMEQDPKIQANRLGLLHRVVAPFDRFGDFRNIVEEGASPK